MYGIRFRMVDNFTLMQKKEEKKYRRSQKTGTALGFPLKESERNVRDTLFVKG